MREKVAKNKTKTQHGDNTVGLVMFAVTNVSTSIVAGQNGYVGYGDNDTHSNTTHVVIGFR